MSSVELDFFILAEGIFDVLILEKLLNEIGFVSSIESYYLVGRGKFIDGARIIEGNNMKIGLPMRWQIECKRVSKEIYGGCYGR